MNNNSWALFSIFIGLGLLFLPVSPQAAELAAVPALETAASDAESGSEEQEVGSTPSIPFSFAWGVTLASKYLFQGMDFSNGEPVLQPEFAFSANDFSVTLWINYDLKTQKSDEFDLVFQYGWELQGLSLAAGYAHYNYPHRGWEPSQEVLVDISYSARLNPSLSVHYDFDVGNGTYSTLSISHGVESSPMPLYFGINFFHQSNYYELTGFPSMELNASSGYTTGSLEITPSLSYFLTWDNGDFRGANAVPDEWLFSVNIAQSF